MNGLLRCWQLSGFIHCYVIVLYFTIFQQQENKEKLEHWFGKGFLLRVA